MTTQRKWTIECGEIRQAGRAIAAYYGGEFKYKSKEFVKEAESNARLIAAAPDLLEACECTLKMLREYGQDILPLCKGSVIDHLLEAAVAKTKNDF